MTATTSLIAPSPAPGWYCLRVAARREQLTARQVRLRTGVAVFAPQIRVPRPAPHSTARLSSEALFPGYVFARFRYPHDVRHVASTPGVLQLVAFGGAPKAVDDRVIEHLDREVRLAGAAQDARSFSEGDWVRIVAGCFRGAEGRVLANSGNSRVSVMLHLLGHDIQLSVPADQLADTTMPSGLRSGEGPASGGR